MSARTEHRPGVDADPGYAALTDAEGARLPPGPCWRPRHSAHKPHPICMVTKTVIAHSHRSCEHVKVSTLASAMVGWASPSVLPKREVIVHLRIQGYRASMNEVFPEKQNGVTAFARGGGGGSRACAAERSVERSGQVAPVRPVTRGIRPRLLDTQPLNFRV